MNSGDLRQRSDLVFLAKLSEQLDHFDDMASHVTKLVHLTNTSGAGGLTAEERGLLSTAFKNLAAGHRRFCRFLVAAEAREFARRSPEKAAVARANRRRVDAELSAVCREVLDLVELSLLPAAREVEGRVFYLKMMGDYRRYLAEFKEGKERKEAAEVAKAAYEAAQEFAVKNLPPKHPLRLGLLLNFSVFYHDIMGLTDEARWMAKTAFHGTPGDDDVLYDEWEKDSSHILELISENLKNWPAESQEI